MDNKKVEKKKEQKPKPAKPAEKSKKKGDVSDVENGPTTKEDLALINDAYEDNEMGEVKVEIPDDSEDKKPKDGAEKAEEVSFIHYTFLKENMW